MRNDAPLPVLLRRLRLAAAAAPFLLAAAVGPSAAAITEEALADQVAAAIGPALPAGAHIAVALTPPTPDLVERVTDFAYDPRSGQFRAEVTSGGQSWTIFGRAAVEMDVPVPVRRLAPGETIDAADLTTVHMPVSKVSARTATSVDQLVGLAAKHMLVPGRPVPTSSVGTPTVVGRNKTVTLIFEDGPLFLSTTGRALQDAGVGEVVRVMNASSNVVVTGIATGPQTVTVRPRGPEQ